MQGPRHGAIMDVFTLGAGGRGSPRRGRGRRRDLPSRTWIDLDHCVRGRSPARRHCGRRVRGGSGSIRPDRGERWPQSGPGPAVPDRVVRSDSGVRAADHGPGCRVPGWGRATPWKAMPRTQGSTGRERAVGTHFPMLAAAIAVAALAWQLAGRCASSRVCPGTSVRDATRNSARTTTSFAPRRRPTRVGYPVTPTLTHGSGRPTRSAGLGSGSTRTSSAGWTGLPGQATRLALLLLGK